MNNHFHKKAELIPRIILIFILGIVGLKLLYNNYGYVFAFGAPSGVTLTNKPILESASYILNDKEITDNVMLDIKAINPRPFFGGPRDIIFQLITSEGSIDLPFPSIDLIEGNKIEISNFYFSINNDFPDQDKICTSDVDNNNSVISGFLEIDQFKEKFKRMSISGSLHLDSSIYFTYSCAFTDEKNLQKLVNVEDAIINFTFDTPLIYTWAGKGGPTYKL